jgi:AcrR family transcriptional regulator
MQPPPRLQPPQQPRSRKTLERIVAAGLAILEEEGPSGVTVQAVVSRARSSVGSFYARFRGKDDLLAYLADSVRDSAIAEWRESVAEPQLSGALLPEMVASAVDHLVEVRERWDASVKAAAGLADRSSDHDAFRRSVVEELATRLLERRSEVTHPHPDVAVRVGLWAVLGVIDHEGSSVTTTDLDSDGLRRECATLLMSYLAGRPATESGRVEFFDVWS